MPSDSQFDRAGSIPLVVYAFLKQTERGNTMEKELYTRLLKAIGKHHINLMEPKELLEISIVTIETIVTIHI